MVWIYRNHRIRMAMIYETYLRIEAAIHLTLKGE